MKTNEKAVITVIGADKKGIIARVSAVMLEHDANILDISQTVISGLFNMVLIADIPSENCAFEKLSDRIKVRSLEVYFSLKSGVSAFL